MVSQLLFQSHINCLTSLFLIFFFLCLLLGVCNSQMKRVRIFIHLSGRSVQSNVGCLYFLPTQTARRHRIIYRGQNGFQRAAFALVQKWDSERHKQILPLRQFNFLLFISSNERANFDKFCAAGKSKGK